MLGVPFLVQSFAILYGLAVGSFVAACVVRIPEDRSLWVPSSCPRCAAPVAWHDNLPVVSWLWLRARCRQCGSAISAVYPLVELLVALMAWLVARHLIRTPEALDLAHVLAWVLQFGLLAALVLAATVDIRHRIIPDETSVYAVPVGVVGHALLEALGYDGWLAIGWRQAVLGCAMWGGLFASIHWGARLLLRKDALGAGDVKLAAMLGAFLGVQGGLLALMIGSLIGAVGGIVATLILWRRPYLPFAPPLAVGASLYVLYGDVAPYAVIAGLWP